MSSLNDMFEEEEEPVIYRTKSKHINIRDPDLSGIDLPDDLKQVALQIYRTCGFSTHKGNNRNKILYGCFFIAGLELRKPQIPQQLMKAIGFDMKKRNSCDGIIRQIQTKIGAQCKIFTPVEIVEPFLLNFDNGLQIMNKIEKTWNRIKTKECVRLIDIKVMAIWLLIQHNQGKEADLCNYYGVSEQTYKKEISKMNEDENEEP